MNPQLFQQAVKQTIAELRAMNPEEFRAEIAKRRNSDIANLFAIAREFDDNFMRFPPRGEPTSCRAKPAFEGSALPASEGSALPGGVTEEMLENRVSRIVEGHLAKVLPKLVEEVLSRKLEQERKISGN
jgi:hypothetical protein